MIDSSATLFRYGCIGCVLWLVSHSSFAQEVWAESYRLELAGDYVAAARVLEPVLAADSDHEFALMRTAWLDYLSGNYNESIRGYRRALELNAESLETKLGLTLPLLAQQRWREAAGVAQEVLAVAPWNYYAHERLMVAEEGLRQWQRLAEHAAAVAVRYPSDATALVYLARAQAQRGLDAEARAAYTAVLERFPDHEEAHAYLDADRR